MNGKNCYNHKCGFRHGAEECRHDSKPEGCKHPNCVFWHPRANHTKHFKKAEEIEAKDGQGKQQSHDQGKQQPHDQGPKGIRLHPRNLAQFGHAKKKFWPRIGKGLNQERLEEICKALILKDGHEQKDCDTAGYQLHLIDKERKLVELHLAYLNSQEDQILKGSKKAGDHVPEMVQIARRRFNQEAEQRLNGNVDQEDSDESEESEAESDK
jgi:hypothetical protein